MTDTDTTDTTDTDDTTPDTAKAALSEAADRLIRADADALEAYGAYRRARETNPLAAASLRSRYGTPVIDRGRILAQKLASQGAAT